MSAAHTDGQQYRTSTNRAHSRRHVVIIVSVVVQWCGADLHSEGHGEQQGRREVRQTHTEGTLHEERAAATHAPYAAHHARHTLRSTATGTHTQPCRSTNTQMEEGEANRSGTQGSTACTQGESGPSCRHPSRRVRTHKRIVAAHTAAQKQSNNKKRRSPHTTWIFGSREVQPIFITKIIQLCLTFVHIQRTPLHAGLETTAAAAQKKIIARNGMKQATVFLFSCLNVGRCLHAWCFFVEGKHSCLHRVLGITAGCTIICFLSSCECFLCWCSQEFGSCCSCLCR
ncbi:hypothetical protein TCDM_11129 [Trypanosoma cruzi Dm28c]|uniref:Uncharacterized protein n=1 Tax=Trypanosoma cruzi Dm28c TaxID=1416333 RepID=V5AKT4_TRYCR|nr:hypothetical protein TCDM_11129 [Trypanosoma cruzi Dm28c]